jgi:uncharacterized protein (DUF952 family)
MTFFMIVKKSDWEAAKPTGFFETPSLKAEGFIHASNEDQVVSTASKHFKGQSGLVLLAVDQRKVKAEVKFENTSGGTALFPHIYGRLNTNAVSAVYDFPPKPDGTFELPKMNAMPVSKGANVKPC